MGWVTDEGLITVWWLLALVAVNIGLGLRTWSRGRADRATIRRVEREGIGPVEAARHVDNERDAARTAVYLLYMEGAVDVSDEGVLTAVPDAPEPDDPVLSALLDGLGRRGAEGTRLYEILDEPDFEAYRNRLDERVPQVRRYAGRNRVASVAAGYALSFGMSMHALLVRAPVPVLGWHFDAWLLLWLPVWVLVALCAAAWPSEYSRRWPRFDRYCQQRVDAALDGLPAGIRTKVGKEAYRPTPPRRTSRPQGGPAGPGSPHAGGGDWADEAASSCGSGGCGGD
ncbi:hypothetical protein [Streptomyces qinzhouensis]|uniref:TIGR04222 domain-containing membrane protein n=1 Tax=Streptomyces qinzhouensis TaxID=2599401 RepID=A0A5B8JDT0_9ACTN|nr:hypothetical protein [Streptomyces qinzhouensis]QDY79885.1 hypothetical protein FQU76_28855 [Streptomyces qinzhouensis]